MKCRANNSVQRREFKRVRNDVTDETLSFCAHACFLSLLDIFHWSVDKCFDANREMNKQFHQIINKNTALNDYSAILKQDYNYSAAKVRVKIFDRQQAAEEWERKAIELRKVCFYRYITVAIVVLRDKFGWGYAMSDKFQSAMNARLEAWINGKETLESMNEKLKERGIRLTLGNARELDEQGGRKVG